nr:zinc-binding dehydrogenase [Caldicoprobacter guelmensis]
MRKIKAGPGAELVEIPIPTVGFEDVLVRVKATALCKSDVDVYMWTPLVASANYPLPLTMGHEFMGEIVEVGKSVKNLQVGDCIVGETHIPCENCVSCWSGNRHICDNMGVLGRNVDGSFAEYIKLPAVSAIKVDKTLLPAYGALMEPLGTALHALTKGEVWGKSVLVLGCGIIGLMAVHVAKLLGATRVYAVSTSPTKLEKAVKLGADKIINSKKEDMVEVIMEETRGKGVGVVIETTGNEVIINKAIDVLQKAGRYVFVGMIEENLTIEKFMTRVVYKEIVLTGIFGRRIYETWILLQEFLETKNIDFGIFIGAEMPLTDYEKGFQQFSDLTGRLIFYP